MFLILGSSSTYVLILVFTLLLFIAACFLLFINCLVKSRGDQAIVRTGAGGFRVSFSRMFVLPFLHQHELVPTAVHKLSYERTGKWVLKFNCGALVELVADLLIRVNQDERSVKIAISHLGIDRLNSVDLLREHFSSLFNDSLESIAGQTDFKTFASDKDSFRNKLFVHIGKDLHGMILDDISIHHLERTDGIQGDH